MFEIIFQIHYWKKCTFLMVMRYEILKLLVIILKKISRRDYRLIFDSNIILNNMIKTRTVKSL